MQINNLITNRRTTVGLGMAASIGVAALLAGCGGTSSSKSSIRSTVPSTPTAYGLGATALINGGQAETVSSLESADESTLYLTGATASTSVPINTIQGPTGTIPLGFAVGAAYENGASGVAAAPGASVKFRVTLSNGTDANGTTYQINPSGVSMTSPDFPGQTIPLTFSLNTGSNYGLANGQYVTGALTLPTTLTTGLHTFVVSVTDLKPQTTTTTYQAVVVKPGDAAVEALVVGSDGATPDAGATVTITNPTGGTAQGIADQQGIVVLFTKAVPTTATLTVTNKYGTATQTVVVASGALTSTVTDAKGNVTPLQIVETAAPAAGG